MVLCAKKDCNKVLLTFLRYKLELGLRAVWVSPKRVSPKGGSPNDPSLQMGLVQMGVDPLNEVVHISTREQKEIKIT